MTTEQALEVLAQASSMAAMPKQSHIQVEQAIAVIKKELTQGKKPEQNQEK